VTVIVALPDRMLSDSICSTDDATFPCTKILRHKASLVGVAGKNRSIEKFVRWYMKTGGKTMLDFNELDDGGDSFSVIVLNKRGIWYYEDCSMPDLVTRGYHGCGSGWAATHGAMRAGATPRQAIEIACSISPGCGLPVQEFIL
jgi:hypothetical protein